MIIFKTATALQKYLNNQEAFPAKTGFVPTMGALHPGHVKLVQNSVSEQAITVVSIFVNPTQFNDPSDFSNYPVTIEKDIQMLEKAGCDILFLPAVEEVYPGGIPARSQYDLGRLETLLEGFYRPGHFQGVCQVMDRLLHIVKAGHLYMGSKDYQQCMVIKKLIDHTGLSIQFHMVPTVREADGLALSSRNLRLDEGERKKAISIYGQFEYIRNNAELLPVAALQENAATHLLENGFHKVDYVAIADPTSLEPIAVIEKDKPFLVLVAAFIGKVRLIDNMQMAI